MLSLRSLVRAAGLLGLGALFAPALGQGQASLLDGFGGTANYGADCVGENDDGSSAQIDLTPFFPSGLRFFDRTHTSVYINTNGNISFSEPVPTFTAQPFPVANQPMIAPYWADVDIRTFEGMMGPFMRNCSGPADGDTTLGAACHEPTENGIWWHLEDGRLVVTWDRVSYYKCHSELAERMSFQLVLTAVESGVCGGGGDFDVEFRYNRCEWTTGDASGGSGGFGGTQAQAGFDAGNEMDFVEISGSRTDEIHNILCQQSNVGDVATDPSLAGIWRFEIRSGEVICPGAGDACPTGMMGVCATGRTQCVGAGLECRPEVAATDEQCDGLDNDCDGMTDETSVPLCGDFEECRDGSCVGVCFEGSCPSGYTCVDGRLCVEEACLGVTCADGERCEGGTCTAPCDGVTCPNGLNCVAGQCVDLCAGASCEECTVCEGGSCIPECALSGCAAGEACEPTGHCIDADCLGVTCSTGQHCEGGSCVDSCLGAVCPAGEVCMGGQCLTEPEPMDAGVPRTDWGVPGSLDGNVGTLDGGSGTADGGGVVDGGDDGCGCRVAGAPSERSPLWLLSLVGLVFWRRRR